MTPIAPLADSVELHLASHARRSHAIYLAVMTLLLAGLAALPLVRVPVVVRGAGLVRPTSEKHEVRARTSGLAERVLARPYQAVSRGEPLLVLRSAEHEQEASLLATQAREAGAAVHDLALLTGQEGSQTALRFARYVQERAQFTNALNEVGVRREKAERDAERAREMFGRALVPRTELEEAEFRLASLRAEAATLRAQTLARWQAELSAARLRLAEIRSRQERLAEAGEQYVVTAPVAGTVEELASLAPGSYVQAGEVIAVLSPNAALLAELYVPPRDVGLLRVGMPVRLQVDAFNYTEWGVLSGRVREVGGDFVLLDGQPVFRVAVALDQTHLTLKNGVRGSLRKGMTLQARFQVTERSLWQLLFDDVNDWLNPNTARSAPSRLSAR